MNSVDGMKLGRWTVWAPRLTAVGFAIPAGVFTLFACFVLAMGGLPLTGMLTFPLGIAAIAASVGAMVAWAPGRPFGIAFASLFGFSSGWLLGAVIFFAFHFSPVMDRDPVYGLPLGWGLVGMMTGPTIVLWRRRAVSWRKLATVWRLVGATVSIILCAFMLFQSCRLVTYKIPQAGERIGTVPLHHKTGCLAVSPDGTLFAVGGRSEDRGIVRLVDGATLSTRDWELAHPVRAVAFSPDQPVLAIGCRGESSSFVCLWDLETSTELRQIEAKQQLMSLRYSPDGHYLKMLAWDDDSQMAVLTLWQTDPWAKCFDLETEAGLLIGSDPFEGQTDYGDARNPKDHSCLIAREATTFSPDGQSIAIAKMSRSWSESGLLEIWDTQKQLIHSAPLRFGNVQYVTFLADGKIMLAGQFVYLYDPASGELHFVPCETAPGARTPTTPARCFEAPQIAAYSPQVGCWHVPWDGRILASGGARIVGGDGFQCYGNAMLTDVRTGEFLGEVLFEEIDTWVRALAVSPNGETLALIVGDSWPHSGSPERLELFNLGATRGL